MDPIDPIDPIYPIYPIYPIDPERDVLAELRDVRNEALEIATENRKLRAALETIRDKKYGHRPRLTYWVKCLRLTAAKALEQTEETK